MKNISQKLLLVLIWTLFIFGCSSESISTREHKFSERKKEISDKIEKCKALIRVPNYENYEEALILIKEIEQSLENVGSGNSRLDIVKIRGKIEELLTNKKVKIHNAPTTFIAEGNHEFSFIGIEGDSVFIKLEVDQPFTYCEVIEEQSHRSIRKTWNSKSFKTVFVPITNNVYTVRYFLKKGAYFSTDCSRLAASIEKKFHNHQITRDSIIVNKKTKYSKLGKELVFESIYQEPKKFIVKGNLRSGSSKIYLPIDVPQNTKEFIYQLRISGNETSVNSDGQLIDKVRSSHRRIKVLGLPIWDSESKGSSLTREIINTIIEPTKEEDYTANVFFFDKENEVKKFLNYNGVNYGNAFKYDIRNSALGSQSRNGLIKKPKSGYSYLGLVANSNFSNTHIWLDVVALQEKKFQYEIRKKIQ